jgi:hypothetical protein
MTFSLVRALPSPTSARVFSLCSAGSQVLQRSPTSPERACPRCGFGPSRTGLVPGWAETPRRSPGSRAYCFSACRGSQTTQGRPVTRDLSQPAVLPSPSEIRFSALILVFRSSIARPTGTPIYASASTSRCSLQDSGPRWIRCSLLVGLFHSQQHAGLSRRTSGNRTYRSQTPRRGT